MYYIKDELNKMGYILEKIPLTAPKNIPAHIRLQVKWDT
jgi:hypothetical protein